MKKEKNTLIRWFRWWGWYPDKLEAWLEAKAAEGWHLTKADRILLRFHFRRGASRKIRVCVDYPQIPASTLYIRRISIAPVTFKVILAVYTLLLVMVIVSLIATIRQIGKLKSRKR